MIKYIDIKFLNFLNLFNIGNNKNLMSYIKISL